MRKQYFGFIALLFAAGFCMASCSKEHPLVEERPAEGYVISIPVQAMGTRAVAEGDGEATATFKTTENVYIYNQTTRTLDDATLHPSTDEAFTILSGTLNKTYSEGNTLTVLYNTDSKGVVNYSAQDGSIDHVVDAGTANVTVTSISGDNEITTNVANIQNLQSIFRFQFRDASTNDLLSGIRFVRIFSEDNKLQTQYNVLSDTPTYGTLTLSSSNNLDNNHSVYAGLRFAANAGDAIVFQVVTSDGKVYSGSKNAPSSGFVNGKFYTTTVDVNLYTFTVAEGKKVCFSPGDLGVDNGTYSFTEPFVTWGWGNKSSSTAKRVWFDYPEIASGLDICGINWRNLNSLSTGDKTYNPHEWNGIINRTNMNNDVDAFYRVIVPNHGNCLLLPPDETQSSDIGDDIRSGSVSDYTKYLGKEFVFLMRTGRGIYTNSGISWGMTSQGWYWALWNKMGTNRTYLYWTESATPAVTHIGNQVRMRVRLVHDVTAE